MEPVKAGEIVRAKAKELFDVCDKQKKGFINREDMQRLRGELDLNNEQLCEVFSRLDADQSGCLSFDEFCKGFGGFLELHSSENFEPDSTEPQVSSFEPDVVEIYENLENTEVPQSYLENGGASVEEFVRKVVDELNETRKEKEAAERTLKERAESFEKRVQQLSEEMEEQMERDRQRIFEKEVMRERNISMELKGELKLKEEQLHEVIGKQHKLEQEVSRLTSGKSKFINENNQLLQLNESLATELESTRRKLDETQLRIELLKQQQIDAELSSHAEEEARRLDLEKRSLMKQVEVLRMHNRKLRDDHDELQSNAVSSGQATAMTSTPDRKFPLFTQGSNVGKYFPEVPLQTELALETVDSESERSSNSAASDSSESESKGENQQLHTSPTPTPTPYSPSPHIARHQATRSSRNKRFYRKLSQVPDGRSSSDSDIPERRSAIGESDTQQDSPFLSSVVPDRVYKVVFVGNSEVGKTSFIQRLVSETFREKISATIGIDYQVKTLAVSGRQVALQLWDTAGQERFRSITRLYFRKADGVVVIYDVTNEKSFLSVRSWMQNVQEGTDESTVIMLLGNKCDVETEARQVQPQDGAQLAKEYRAKFFETSAKLGSCVTQAMTSLSRELIQLEDKQRQNVLTLATAATKQSGNNCCVGRKLRGLPVVSSPG